MLSIGLSNKFDRVMGIQFLSFLRSFPAFGKSFRKDTLCEVVNCLLSRLYCHTEASIGPYKFHTSPMIE